MAKPCRPQRRGEARRGQPTPEHQQKLRELEEGSALHTHRKEKNNMESPAEASHQQSDRREIQTGAAEGRWVYLCLALLTLV
ncbi:hypothetical protein EYF80_058084 [Liparis tanakae]|uniref:Uncharacterized protein n=1 Tax=Liparis tanakae TaxID=230148 RepID=A0A4Z2ES68_9TELE|nr:hypothetical protein EYF80_058084 [Liparis tanakae]